MKLLTTRVECRGCQAQEIVEFAMPKMFLANVIPFKCKKCGSKCAASISKSLFRKKILIKVNMIEHTKTLLNILEKRRKHAKSHKTR